MEDKNLDWNDLFKGSKEDARKKLGDSKEEFDRKMRVMKVLRMVLYTPQLDVFMRSAMDHLRQTEQMNKLMETSNLISGARKKGIEMNVITNATWMAALVAELSVVMMRSPLGEIAELVADMTAGDPEQVQRMMEEIGTLKVNEKGKVVDEPPKQKEG